MNHYIYGTDDKINVPFSNSPDQSLWYFVAPQKFLGNKGIAYGGSISFNIAAFSGDFSKLNGLNVICFDIIVIVISYLNLFHMLRRL